MANITIVATGATRAPTQLDLAERFLADGHDVRCIASRNALRFLSSYMARRPRYFPMYARVFRPQLLETFAYYKEKPKSVPHIAEGKWGDVFVMCPASCNSVGKLASGIGDNYPLQVLRAVPRTKRVIVVPSMNPEMWFDPQLQRNVDILNATEKYRVVCPARGMMLSGDMGFGAQAPIEEIVGETYRALGILSPEAEAALSGRATVPPWQEELERQGDALDVVLIDEDIDLREQLAARLRDEHPEYRVHEFSTPGQALEWLNGRDPALIVTDLAFSSGASAQDLIDRFRRPGRERDVQIIATSVLDRERAGAERLGRQEVHYLPKPVNVTFAVGMIEGCLNSARHGPPVRRRRLAAGETLFREGDEGSELFLVEEGKLSVREKETEIATIGEDELVGELAFFGEGRRTATAVAAEDSVVVEVEVEGARDYVERQPVWFRTMLDTLVKRVLADDAAAVSRKD